MIGLFLLLCRCVTMDATFRVIQILLLAQRWKRVWLAGNPRTEASLLSIGSTPASVAVDLERQRRRAFEVWIFQFSFGHNSVSCSTWIVRFSGWWNGWIGHGRCCDCPICCRWCSRFLVLWKRRWARLRHARLISLYLPPKSACHFDHVIYFLSGARFQRAGSNTFPCAITFIAALRPPSARFTIRFSGDNRLFKWFWRYNRSLLSLSVRTSHFRAAGHRSWCIAWAGIAVVHKLLVRLASESGFIDLFFDRRAGESSAKPETSWTVLSANLSVFAAYQPIPLAAHLQRLHS